MLGLIVPGQIIPTYMLCSYLHLKTFAGAAAVLTAANLPLGTFLYLGALKSIPRDIDEAAILDGCGSLTLFFPAAQAHDGDALYPDVYEHLERFRDDDLFPEHV